MSIILSKTNIDIWYKEYLKKRENIIKTVTRRKSGKAPGVLRDDIEVSNRHDFETDFRSMIEDNPGKSGAQIARMLAGRELYKRSWKQAENFAKAHIEHFGGNMSLNLIYRYLTEQLPENNIWDAIKKRRMELNETMSTYESNRTIAREFFWYKYV